MLITPLKIFLRIFTFPFVKLSKLGNVEWNEILNSLSDNEMEQVIRGCNSQAYYQEFEVSE